MKRYLAIIVAAILLMTVWSSAFAVYDPEMDHSVNDTIRHADKMMYANKRKHKDADDQ